MIVSFCVNKSSCYSAEDHFIKVKALTTILNCCDIYFIYIMF